MARRSLYMSSAAEYECMALRHRYGVHGVKPKRKVRPLTLLVGSDEPETAEDYLLGILLRIKAGFFISPTDRLFFFDCYAAEYTLSPEERRTHEELLVEDMRAQWRRANR